MGKKQRNSDNAETNRVWMRIAVWLVGATMAYNGIEALIAIWSEMPVTGK